MQISASIFHPAKPPSEFAAAAIAAGSNCLHIDYADDTKPVLQPCELPLFSKEHPLPLDIHLVTANLKDVDIATWNAVRPEYLTIQLEPLTDISMISKLKNYKGKAGAGLSIDSPLDMLDPVHDCFSHVLLMCGTPGQPGSSFNEKCIVKIIETKKRYPQLAIHVDGGIDSNAMNLLRAFSVSLVVSGSYLAKCENMYANICNLRFGHNTYSLAVEDIMIPYGRLPIVTPDTPFKDLLSIISHWLLGMVMVVEDDRHLAGIITDGDLRRALQTIGPSIFNSTAKQIMNPSPIVIEPETNILTFAKLVSDMRRGIIVIPVADKWSGTLMGAIGMHQHLSL